MIPNIESYKSTLFWTLVTTLPNSQYSMVQEGPTEVSTLSKTITRSKLSQKAPKGPKKSHEVPQGPSPVRGSQLARQGLGHSPPYRDQLCGFQSTHIRLVLRRLTASLRKNGGPLPGLQPPTPATGWCEAGGSCSRNLMLVFLMEIQPAKY